MRTLIRAGTRRDSTASILAQRGATQTLHPAGLLLLAVEGREGEAELLLSSFFKSNKGRAGEE